MCNFKAGEHILSNLSSSYVQIFFFYFHPPQLIYLYLWFNRNLVENTNTQKDYSGFIHSGSLP